MENDLFIVSFIRQDSLPNEDYYYYNQEAAEEHFNLFKEDDSGLYKRIELIKNSVLLEEIVFQLLQQTVIHQTK